MKQVSITEAVRIKNQRVKPFSGEKEYLTTGGLIGNTIKTESVTYKTKPSRADLSVTENQLIVARMKETNKVLLINKNTSDLIVSTGFLVLSVQEGWHPGFLFHYFVSDFFQKQKNRLSIGATQKAINNEKFKKILIPELSLEDQKRIVKILDKADALRQKRKQAIGLLDDYLKSVFLEMFGDSINNPNIYQPIGKTTKFIDYRGKTPEKSNSGTPLITAKHVKKGFFSFFPEEYITEEKYNKIMTRGFPRPNDVLFTTEGATLGNVCRIPLNMDKFSVGQRLITLQCKDCLTSEYLHFVLLNGKIRQEIFKQSTGSAAQGIRSAVFYKIKIPVPSVKLQEKFSEIVNESEFIRQKMMIQIEKLEFQFQALMQKAFKGEL